MPAPEPGNTRDLLIFLNERFRLAANFRRRNLDLDLAFRALFGIGGAHYLPFKAFAATGRRGDAILGMTSLKTFRRNHEFKDTRRATSNGRTTLPTHQSNCGRKACALICRFSNFGIE
jgi:hypothetical protein